MLPVADDNLDALAGLQGLKALQRHGVTVFGEAGLPPGGSLCDDTLAAEVPVALVFNGVSHAVMMATPRDLSAFALGFALSEGIIDAVSESRGIEVCTVASARAGLPPGVDAIEVHIDIGASSFARLKHQRRSLAGRTGCGVCGVESLKALDLLQRGDQARATPPEWASSVNADVVLKAIAAMSLHQPLHLESGAVHAAGWAGLDGAVSLVMEDVGRHNALDKLLGSLALSGVLQTPGFVVMSSRASHELVRKCARLGVAALATVSAPTSMGVLMAEHAGLRLWGLCRPPRAVLYVS